MDRIGLIGVPVDARSLHLLGNGRQQRAERQRNRSCTHAPSILAEPIILQKARERFHVCGRVASGKLHIRCRHQTVPTHACKRIARCLVELLERRHGTRQTLSSICQRLSRDAGRVRAQHRLLGYRALLEPARIGNHMLDLSGMFLLCLCLNTPQSAENAQALLLRFGELRQIRLHGHIDVIKIHS